MRRASGMKGLVGAWRTVLTERGEVLMFLPVTRSHIHLNKGAIGFDGDDKLVAAYRGAQAHVKTRARSDCER